MSTHLKMCHNELPYDYSTQCHCIGLNQLYVCEIQCSDARFQIRKFFLAQSLVQAA